MIVRRDMYTDNEGGRTVYHLVPLSDPPEGFNEFIGTRKWVSAAMDAQTVAVFPLPVNSSGFPSVEEAVLAAFEMFDEAYRAEEREIVKQYNKRKEMMESIQRAAGHPSGHDPELTDSIVQPAKPRSIILPE